MAKAFTEIMSTIQFSYKHSSGYPNKANIDLLKKSPKDPYAACWHRSYTCTGISHCEFVHEKLVSYHDDYNRVEPEIFLDLRKDTAQPVISHPKAQIEQRTRQFYHAFLRNWSSNPCIYHDNQTYTCPNQSPTVFYRNELPFIGCSRSSEIQTWHFAIFVNRSIGRLDIDFLALLCKHNGLPSTIYQDQDCYHISQRHATRRICSYMHNTRDARIMKTECKAKFDLFIPCNWDRFPYMLLVCRGSHCHFPPPPTKLPKDIGQEIENAITAHDLLDLTTRKLMFSPRFANIIRRYGTSAVRYIHGSLNIEDKITAMIHKQRLLQYPEGTMIAGVWREYLLDQTKDCDDQWIREVYFFDEDHTQWMVICCTYEQAKLFQNVKHIEMDLAFKMVHEKNTVFSVSAYDDKAEQIMVYAYVFLNVESRNVYKKLFERLFTILGNVGRSPVRWAYQSSNYADAEGIRTVTVDMCRKQAPGLGDYLAELDPRFSWSEHLQYILIFCQVHIRRAFRKRFGPTGAVAALDLIFNATSREEVRQIIERTCIEFPETRSWFKHKLVDWTLAGMSQEFSKIHIEWRRIATHHTGVSESSHYRDNQSIGRKLPLLSAIKKTYGAVQEVLEQRRAKIERGIERTWQSTNQMSKIAKNHRKIDKRNKKAARSRLADPRIPFNPRNPYMLLQGTMLPPSLPDDSDNSSMISDLQSISSTPTFHPANSQIPDREISVFSSVSNPTRTPNIRALQTSVLSKSREEELLQLERDVEVMRRLNELKKEMKQLQKEAEELPDLPAY